MNITRFLGVKTKDVFFVGVLSRLYTTDNSKKLLEKFKDNGKVLRKKQLLERYDKSINNSDEVLDCVARVFSFQDPCTAVILKEDILNISYNNSQGARLAKVLFEEKEHKKILESRINVLIKSTLEHVSLGDMKVLLPFIIKYSMAYDSHLLALEKVIRKVGSVFSKDKNGLVLIKCLGDYFKILSDYKVEASKVKSFKSDYQKHPLQAITDENDKVILDKYYEILDFVTKNNNIDNKIKEPVLKHLLPVLKDITRVIDFLPKVLFKEPDDNIVDQEFINLPIKVLTNSEKLHCEVNMIKHHKDEVGYIGLSKLSCFICELILKSRPQNETFDYAGSHGMYFHYDAKGFIDESMLLELKKAVEIIVAKHNDYCEIEGNEPLLPKESPDLIDDVLKLDEQKFAELFGYIDASEDLHQVANYCFWHPEHTEDEINGFHPENPQADLLGYTIALRESLGLTSADCCPDSDNLY